jgi:DNA-binding NarL/FixJ family response regulator
MAKIRVLLVDDHAILRDGIHALLALQDDIEVVGEAADGREAIEKARQLAPDIVLMDIVMPLMDGLEACRRICKENPKIRVIVLTQYDNKEYVSSSVKAGAAGCISKRAVASELVSAIRVVHGGDYFLYPPIAAMLVEDYLQRVGEAEADDYDRLTAREREVLKLVAEGRTNREIAELLVISVRTVIGHRTSLMEKLDIHNRSELVKYAIRKGLTSVDT